MSAGRSVRGGTSQGYGLLALLWVGFASVACFIVIAAASHHTPTPKPLTVIHPTAITAALAATQTAATHAHGAVAPSDIRSATEAASGVALIANLGQIKNYPRVVKYRVQVGPTSSIVCVEIPAGTHAVPIAVVCPA